MSLTRLPCAGIDGLLALAVFHLERLLGRGVPLSRGLGAGVGKGALKNMTQSFAVEAVATKGN